MSIEINWNNLTTGQEGQELAESIKCFIHDKFQQVQLPRFIRSVQVHSFNFGKEHPVVELKDVSDPLPQFYEDGSDDEDGEQVDDVSGVGQEVSYDGRDSQPGIGNLSVDLSGSPQRKPQSLLERRLLPLQAHFALTDHLASPVVRSTTPGILGSTSNINSYFSLPPRAGLLREQTPLATVASGTTINQYNDKTRLGSTEDLPIPMPGASHSDPSSRPSSSAHIKEPHIESAGASGEGSEPSQHSVPSPYDTQITLHISYTGSLGLTLTAEISLDYPMPSLIGIPVKLSITGLSFDGVALLAYLKKKANFCFLGREDAQILLRSDDSGLRRSSDDENSPIISRDQPPLDLDKLGGLLKEIKVESEIGRMENGRQALKNVGKVEKFIIEQVRRIFEEELVWPSWWTFLV